MSSTSLRPLAEFPCADRRRVACVLTDIDDTLTRDGLLRPSAFDAMHRLAAAGIRVVPVTGRPAGWCDMIARQWPVAGVVGENGALWFRYDPDGRRIARGYWFDEARRRADRVRLDDLARRIAEAVPAAHPASDQRYRESDLAIDWCEDATALSADELDRIVALGADAGATVRVSSIHVNIWFGEFSKLAMTERFLADALAVDVRAAPDAFVFVGDSPNDATMFGFFPNSVGVANVLNFVGRIDAEPTYVTRSPGGDGFAELADALLAARAA
ncbi:MAG: HAD-IIB family hydrolase [Alphaproteobacteria bacterium]|nr:HAD-IIB family hydrolase [Alphaproteobacteria bacterium]